MYNILNGDNKISPDLLLMYCETEKVKTNKRFYITVNELTFVELINTLKLHTRECEMRCDPEHLNQILIWGYRVLINNFISYGEILFLYDKEE